MKRVLCITAGMNTGGAETFLMKLYRNLDRTQYQMDFCVVSKENYYAKEIEEMGGRLFFIPLKSKHPLQSFFAIRNLVQKYSFDMVMRVNEHSLSTLDLIAAKSGGAKKLIMRSSNASSGSTFKIMLHKMFRILPQMIPDIKLAPSVLAAKYTFGERSVDRNEVLILKNGLDITKFQFSQLSRENYRKELGVQNQLLIGHIGRFSTQKNHMFLLDVFYEIQKKCPRSTLILVGDGELKDEIVNKARRLGIFEKCKFVGIRKDIPELLSAMDLFLFPSLFEGMPNTVIEAQTNGLPCLLADSITKEVKLTPFVQMLSLKDSAERWAAQAIKFAGKDWGSREAASDLMRQKGYDIQDSVNQFVDLVFHED